MRIGVIGSKGFIGREIYKHLPDTDRSPIWCADWDDSYYDIVIDANGSSKKYLAESDPEQDFKASVDSVMNRVSHLKYGKYIYISTIDAEVPGENHYGFNRKLAERIVKHYCDKWTIIRLCSVIGENMTKGIVYDILRGDEIFATTDSLIQVISVKEVVEKIPFTFRNHDHEVLRLYSKGSIEVRDICKMFDANPIVAVDAEKQLYDFKPSEFDCFSELKTPEEYLKETIYERVD